MFALQDSAAMYSLIMSVVLQEAGIHGPMWMDLFSHIPVMLVLSEVATKPAMMEHGLRILILFSAYKVCSLLVQVLKILSSNSK